MTFISSPLLLVSAIHRESPYSVTGVDILDDTLGYIESAHHVRTFFGYCINLQELGLTSGTVNLIDYFGVNFWTISYNFNATGEFC